MNGAMNSCAEKEENTRSFTEKDEIEKIGKEVKEEIHEVNDVCLTVGCAKKPHGSNHGRWRLSRHLHYRHHQHQCRCSDLIRRRVEETLTSHGTA